MLSISNLLKSPTLSAYISKISLILLSNKNCLIFIENLYKIFQLVKYKVDFPYGLFLSFLTAFYIFQNRFIIYNGSGFSSSTSSVLLWKFKRLKDLNIYFLQHFFSSLFSRVATHWSKKSAWVNKNKSELVCVHWKTSKKYISIKLKYLKMQ